MTVKSSRISAAALPQRTAVRRSDLRAARSFSSRELVQSIFYVADRGLSADRLQGPTSGFRPRHANTGRGAATGDGRRSAGRVQRAQPARWYAIVGIRAPSLAHASASGCCAGTTSFSGSPRDGSRGEDFLTAALGVSCFCSALSTCVLRRFRVTRAGRKGQRTAPSDGKTNKNGGLLLAGSLTITRGRVSPRKRHRGVPSVIRVDLPSPGAIR